MAVRRDLLWALFSLTSPVAAYDVLLRYSLALLLSTGLISKDIGMCGGGDRRRPLAPRVIVRFTEQVKGLGAKV